jgi:Acetyltransferase (GNAT) domain
VTADAELLADRGAAALAPDFFRSPEFLEAEGTTHTLRAGPAAIPLIVRDDLAGGLRDAISPYGYPGATINGNGSPVDPGRIEWAASGLVSVFIRDRVGAEPSLAGATARSTVQVHDPSRPRRLRPRLAEQIRAVSRAGWEVVVGAGPETAESDRGAFHRAYTETMRRAGAAERYLFPRKYFDAILGFDRSWLLLARSPAGEPGAGAIAALSDGLLHYYLGGTADEHLATSPFKNVTAAMLDLADELQAPLNLGGGVHPGDGLERFKRGFANSELPFWTHELVCDPEAYERLAAGRDAGDFFPAYRAPGSG